MRWLAAIFGVVVAGITACGPGLAPPAADPRVLERATGDPAAIARLLRGSVINGGLWFKDPACVRQFPTPAKIESDRFAAFATCLAGLHLEPSLRIDALPDVVVMHYAPGIEIEARLVEETSGPRLTWIGYVGRRDPTDVLPTITTDALEVLRLAGAPNGPLDPSTPGLEPLTRDSEFTWFKLCVSPQGEVTTLDPRETTSMRVTRLFEAAARSWRFKPYAPNGQALPVCAMVRMRYPATPLTAKEMLPLPSAPDHPVMIASGAMKRTAGGMMIVPDDRTKMEIQSSGVSKVIGAFRLCVDKTGRVESYLPLRPTGFARYDQRLIAGISQWGYEPVVDEGQPIPVCTVITFIYSQR